MPVSIFVAEILYKSAAQLLKNLRIITIEFFLISSLSKRLKSIT